MSSLAATLAFYGWCITDMTPTGDIGDLHLPMPFR